MTVQRIAITGAAGQLAYSLIFRIANGELLGKNQHIALHLLDLPEQINSLRGFAMELEDCLLPLLHEVKVSTDPYEIFDRVDYAFFLGAKPRGPGMERKDLLTENGKIFVGHGKALGQVASKEVKVLVVGNPCNTNCLILMHHAQGLQAGNFHALSRLDQHRAAYQLARKANTCVDQVSHMAIWGNHSSTQVPDFLHAQIHGKPASEVIADQQWLENEFVATVQQRGAQVIAARGKSSAASAAHAALSSMRSLLLPTPRGEWFSAAIPSHGNPYHLSPDLVFSFPCTSQGHGDYAMVPGLIIDLFLQKKLDITQKELIEERDRVAHLLRGA